jgi:ATP-dependent protease ClpP protease subunit
MLNILQEATGMSARNVKSKLLSPSDVWLTAEEVIKLGVADRIL